MSSWDLLKRQRSRSLAGILAGCGWFGDVRCQCVPAYQTRLWAEADGVEACSLWKKDIFIHSERADWQHLYHWNHDCLHNYAPINDLQEPPKDGCERKTRAEERQLWKMRGLMENIPVKVKQPLDMTHTLFGRKLENTCQSHWILMNRDHTVFFILISTGAQWGSSGWRSSETAISSIWLCEQNKLIKTLPMW